MLSFYETEGEYDVYFIIKLPKKEENQLCGREWLNLKIMQFIITNLTDNNLATVFLYWMETNNLL